MIRVGAIDGFQNRRKLTLQLVQEMAADQDSYRTFVLSGVSTEPGQVQTVTRLRMLLLAIESAVYAFEAVRRNSFEKLPIPDTASARRSISAAQWRFLTRVAYWLAKLAFVGVERKCLCRSYVILCVLRRSGIAAELNVGIRRHSHGDAPTGHCWVTTEGRVIAESGDPMTLYPNAVGAHRKGVRYWIGTHSTGPPRNAIDAGASS